MNDSSAASKKQWLFSKQQAWDVDLSRRRLSYPQLQKEVAKLGNHIQDVGKGIKLTHEWIESTKTETAETAQTIARLSQRLQSGKFSCEQTPPANQDDPDVIKPPEIDRAELSLLEQWIETTKRAMQKTEAWWLKQRRARGL